MDPPPEQRVSEAGEAVERGDAVESGGPAADALDRHDATPEAQPAQATQLSQPSEPTEPTEPHVHLEQRYCPQCATELAAGGGPGGQPACPNCGFVRYQNPKLAAGVVVEHQGRVLLVRRNHEPMHGRWTFPSGFVDAGELVAEAAAREVREEAGVEVRIDRLLGVYSSAGDPVVFVAYAGTSVGGAPVAGDEAFEVGLFEPDALPELAFDHDGAILAAWHGAGGRRVQRLPSRVASRAARCWARLRRAWPAVAV